MPGRSSAGTAKLACEDAVCAADAGASAVRIGWQIDADARGENMPAQLDAWQPRDGAVAASRAWRPACSFMDDTARALEGLTEQPVPGVVHLDSNAGEGRRFEAIFVARQQRFERHDGVLRVHPDGRRRFGPVGLLARSGVVRSLTTYFGNTRLSTDLA